MTPRAVTLLATLLLLPPAALGAEPWTHAALFGADVRTVASVPGEPDLLLAGTSGGQVYLSRDGGASWGPAGTAPIALPGWVVSRLRFDPNRPSRVWAALWGVWGGGAVAFSDDLGASWVGRAQGLPVAQVYTLALVPGRPGWLYAGTRAGVWGSRDEGESWQPLTAGETEIAKVTSLLVDPASPNTVFAGTWRRAYRSDDGGATWRGVFEGMQLDSEVFTLSPVPGRDGELWASTCGWVYHSTDGGGRWQRFNQGMDERRTPSFQVLADGSLLAGTVAGLYRSADGGKIWVRATAPDLAVLAIGYDPARPERIVLGTEGSGIWRSNDGGATFAWSSRGMTNLRVAALAVAGSELVAAVDDAGPSTGFYRSTDGGASFEPELVPAPNVLSLADAGPRLYAATERGLYERSAGSWSKVAELGDRRIEQVATGDDRVLVRTPGELFERRDGFFVPVVYHHGPPAGAALVAGALWVSDAAGLYRLTADANHTIATPFAGGRLARFEDRLLLSGEGGVWSRGGGDAAWSELASGPARALPTGDRRYPLLLVDGEGARLWGREGGAPVALDLPFPARDVTAALLTAGRLLLATSGYGILERPLEGLAP